MSTKYLNRPPEKVEKLVPISFYTVDFRIAGMLGSSGPYTVTVNTIKRAEEIEQSVSFCSWLTPWMTRSFERQA